MVHFLTGTTFEFDPLSFACQALDASILQPTHQAFGGRDLLVICHHFRLRRCPTLGGLLACRTRPTGAAFYDPERFAREILPGLATVKLSEIVEATGMSKAYASDVRRGKWTPHVSTWAALARLIQGTP
jgi:hypothetical protein